MWTSLRKQQQEGVMQFKMQVPWDKMLLQKKSNLDTYVQAVYILNNHLLCQSTQSFGNEMFREMKPNAPKWWTTS
jgi:hypothetical protein